VVNNPNHKEHDVTFSDLKTHLETLTPEQLAANVVWSGDERGGIVKQLWIAEEDWIGTCEGDCEPRSALDPEDAASGDLIIAKGTPQLLVD
jgi:hypothetical protein